MNKDTIKHLIRETLEPVFDELVDTSYKVFSSIADNLPKEMPDDEKLKIIEDIFKRHSEAVISGIHSGVPADLEKQLKEAFNGGK